MFFNVFDRLLKRCDKCIRLSQRLLCELELRDQYTSLIDHDQPITLFHNDALLGFDPTRIQRTRILPNKDPLDEADWPERWPERTQLYPEKRLLTPIYLIPNLGQSLIRAALRHTF